MSEVTTPVEDQKPAENPQEEESKTDWKAEARKWEARAKENKTAAEKLQELEEAKKSELQKAQEAADKAQKQAEEALAEAARLRIAAKHGIGEDHLDLLTGSSDDELEAKAQKLSALIKSTTEEPAPKKGAWAPFDPEEGKSPSGKQSVADQFAEWSDATFN